MASKDGSAAVLGGCPAGVSARRAERETRSGQPARCRRYVHRAGYSLPTRTRVSAPHELVITLA